MLFLGGGLIVRFPLNFLTTGRQCSPVDNLGRTVILKGEKLEFLCGNPARSLVGAHTLVIAQALSCRSQGYEQVVTGVFVLDGLRLT